jgi:DNA end-binding protein Ku
LFDQRSINPVGCKRVNKRTGKDIEAANIVKGVKQDGCDCALLSDEQIKAAYPKSTQTIEIESFVKVSEIPFTLLKTPCYLKPIGKRGKVCALVHDTIRWAGELRPMAELKLPAEGASPRPTPAAEKTVAKPSAKPSPKRAGLTRTARSP